jgi:hypothetical protein
VSVDSATGIAATLARIREITQITAPTAAVPASSASAAATTTDAATSATGDFSSLLSAAASKTATPATTTAPATAGASSTVTGAQLDAWMAKKNPGSPLVGLGDVFVREGQANGIDPRALVSIARAESSLGSDPGARARNNAFGWGPHQTFASWEDNIATVARGLKAGYLDEGKVTLAQIQAKYCPVGAANDPTGLNSNWLRNTTALYAELGGDPNGSVALAEPSIT